MKTPERQPKKTTDACAYNLGVRCTDQQPSRCAVCGWNPKVQCSRLKRPSK